MKTGKFCDEKRKILTDSDKGSWFDHPSEISEEKPDEEQEEANASSPKVMEISTKE